MFKQADVQGNILRGYHKPCVRHLVLEIADPGAARGWLGRTVSGGDDVPQVTAQAPWQSKPDSCFNIGLTFEGLRALGVTQGSLASFPTEFVEGMTARAAKLGDVGESGSDKWPDPFDKPQRIHLIASIYADDKAALDRIEAQALKGGALRKLGARDGANLLSGSTVHFGYKDNISQPRFEGVHDPDAYPDKQPFAPLGTVLLGYPNNFEGLMWRVPTPDVLGRNGTFNAFRILAQDVAGFEGYLTEAAQNLLRHPKGEELLPVGDESRIGEGLSREGALREVVAAQMCGRWRNGTPLALSPGSPLHPEPPNKFDYDAQSRCPYGAHVRRANPRGAQIVQRVANHSRRLIRRGTPYGPPYNPAAPDKIERGLLGNFIGASLGAQFEAMTCDWINVGLQDPRVTGSNDPLIGANEPATSWFDLLLKSGQTIRLRNLPRFVRTRGGAYTFLPSIPAIRYLGSLGK